MYERNEKLYMHKIFHMEKGHTIISIWTFSLHSKTNNLVWRKK
jgi:hypothetical protein